MAITSHRAPVNQRHCRQCGAIKDASEFTVVRGGVTLGTARCKMCLAAEARRENARQKRARRLRHGCR